MLAHPGRMRCDPLVGAPDAVGQLNIGRDGQDWEGRNEKHPTFFVTELELIGTPVRDASAFYPGYPLLSSAFPQAATETLRSDFTTRGFAPPMLAPSIGYGSGWTT
jgi:hypothetical protein